MMSVLLRAPGGTGNADVSEELLKTYLDAGWVRIDEAGRSTKASLKGDTKTAPSTKAQWAALAVELGLELDPKAGKPAIVEAVKAYQDLIATDPTSSDKSDDDKGDESDESEDTDDEDDGEDDGSSDPIDSK